MSHLDNPSDDARQLHDATPLALPLCPQCSERDETEEVERSGARYFCGRCDLAYIGSMDEWLSMSSIRAEYLAAHGSGD